MGVEDLRDRRQSRMFDEQGQIFGQDLAREGLRDSRQNQMFTELMGLAGVKSADELRRRQQLGQEYQTQYDKPFHNLAAIMGQAPMPGSPQFNQIPQTDYMGAVMNAYNAQAQAAAKSGAGFGSILSGAGSLLGSLGSAGGAGGFLSFLSDDRVKENIKLVKKAGKNNIYEYNYIHDPDKRKYRGFLASEVEKISPEAITYKDGLRFVDYEKAAPGELA